MVKTFESISLADFAWAAVGAMAGVYVVAVGVLWVYLAIVLDLARRLGLLPQDDRPRR